MLSIYNKNISSLKRHQTQTLSLSEVMHMPEYWKYSFDVAWGLGAIRKFIETRLNFSAERKRWSRGLARNDL